MQLIDDIIATLSTNEAGSLTSALLNTKVLLHKLGERDSLLWVDLELKGYGNDAVPEYRVVGSTVLGNVGNGYQRHGNQTIPLMHLKDELREVFDTSRLTQSIAAIEEFSQQDETLTRRVPPELYPKLSESYSAGFYVQHAWVEVSAGAVSQVLTEVRSRLLDFLLELSEKFPGEPELSSLKQQSKDHKIGELFNNTVIGDNATIVIGNAANNQIVNSVRANDLESLKDALVENFVCEEDIDELVVAIEADDHRPRGDDGFGEHVSTWIGKMVAKSASTAWEVKVGAAGSLLAGLLTKFYSG